MDLSAMQTAFNTAIDTLGVPATWTQAKPPKQTATGFNVGFRTAGAQDEVVINSFGQGAIIMTFKVSSLPVPPEKFDKISLNNEVYHLEAVHPIHLNGTVIGFKGFVKGRQH